MISIAIIGVLLALLLPAVRGTIISSRSFKCQIAQRSVAFNFAIFADESLTVDRGNFDLGGNVFSLENFIESQYQIDEFWGYPGDSQVEMPDASGNDPMRCPDVRGPIRLRPQGCRRGGVTPYENISFGFNMRLHIAEVQTSQDVWVPQTVRLTSSILGQSMVPLLWDVDGELAQEMNTTPLLSAPSLDSPSIFAGDRFWFPALRHGGKGNYTFIDGHVKETSRPLEERDWQWRYSPHMQPR